MRTIFETTGTITGADGADGLGGRRKSKHRHGESDVGESYPKPKRPRGNAAR